MRYGVTLAASVAAADGIWYLIQYGTAPPGCHVFRGEPEYPRHLRGIVSGVPTWYHEVVPTCNDAAPAVTLI